MQTLSLGLGWVAMMIMSVSLAKFVGIAFGAIFASTSALIFQEPIAYPWQPNHGDNLHPFAIAVLLSIGSAVVAWTIAKLLIGWSRN